MSGVLVTGCCGFLGSHLCEQLQKDGHDVTGCDSLIGGDHGNMPQSMHQRWDEADCCDLDHMKVMMHDVDVVFHTAASPHEGLSVFSPVVVNYNTYMSTVTVATAAVAAGVKRFVFLSSMARYGSGWSKTHHDLAFFPFVEGMQPHPVDPYGIAKVAAEDFLRVMGKAHGMEVVICVPHNVYGEKQRYFDPYRNVAAIFINRMLQGKQPIIYGDGKQQRVFSHVDDCIGPLVKMGFQDGLDGEVINIGPDDDPVTVLFLAKQIAWMLDFKIDPIFMPDRPCEVKNAWPSSLKARELLGYEPRVPLGEGLDRLIAWIKKKGPRPFEYTLPIEIVNEKTPKTWSERLM